VTCRRFPFGAQPPLGPGGRCGWDCRSDCGVPVGQGAAAAAGRCSRRRLAGCRLLAGSLRWPRPRRRRGGWRCWSRSGWPGGRLPRSRTRCWEREARRRQRRLLAALPDALDLPRRVSAGSGPRPGGPGPRASWREPAKGPLARGAAPEPSSSSPAGMSLGAALRLAAAGRVPRAASWATLVAAIERFAPLWLAAGRANCVARPAPCAATSRRTVEERCRPPRAPKIQLVVALVPRSLGAADDRRRPDRQRPARCCPGSSLV